MKARLPSLRSPWLSVPDIRTALAEMPRRSMMFASILMGYFSV